MKKQLTDKDKQLMKKSLQKFQQKGTVIVYGFANKQSGTGFFSNERLILLHSTQKSLRYYSKDPPNMPFQKLSEITQGKGKVVVDKVKNFKCQPQKGKTSTIRIQWEDNSNKKQAWVFSFINAKMMNQWNAAVEEMINGTINKDPTFVLTPNQNQPKKQPINATNNNPNSLLNNPTTTNPTVNSNPTTNNTNINNNPTISSVNKPTNVQNSTKPILNQPTKPSTSTINKPNENPPQTNSSLLKQPTKPTTTNNPTTTTNNPGINTNTNSNNPPPQVNSNPTNTTNQSNPKMSNYNDVSSQIRALRANQPNRFNLTNDLSKKNLNEAKQPQLQPSATDNVSTKRDPVLTNNQSNNNNKNVQPFTKKNTNNQPIQQSSQPVFLLNQNKNINNSRNLQNSQQNLNPTNNNNRLQQSNISAQDQQRHYYEQMKRQQQLRKVPSKNAISSIRSPQQNSQYLGEQNYNSKPMNRTQTQQPNLNSIGNQNSRIRSETGYESNQKRKPGQIKNANNKRWNQIWCTSNNPIQIHEEFVGVCQRISTQIVDELPFLKSQRQYNPIKQQGPCHTYNYEGINFIMHYFQEENSPLESSRDQDERAPMLFNHQTYTQLKRQFYNYNFLLGVTGNKGLIKVPISCFVQYKGILIFCKANIPDGFDKVPPQYFQRQLEEVEQSMRMRFIFNSMSLYAHPQKRYFLISDLDQLIPRMPTDVKPPVYFRKQFLLENGLFIQDQNSLNKIFQVLVKQNIKQFITRFQSLQSWVINSDDLIKQLHRSGLSVGCLLYIYQQTNFPFLKKIIVSEMTKGVFCDILRSQLNSVYQNFPASQFQQLTTQFTDKIILDSVHVIIDELFSYSSRSENIWRIIVKQINKKFKVIISKQDILPGYLLGGVMSSIGLDCDYKTPNLNRKQSFFVNKNTIPRDLLINFYPKLRKYDVEAISPVYSRVQQILTSQPNPENFQQLVRILNLKNNKIPSYCEAISDQIITYLCNFIPLGQHQQFQHIGIYDMLQSEPHTFCSTKVSLLAIKWAAKKKKQQLAIKIFDLKSQQNSFWVSQFNPAISQFYDFFSLYNVSTGNYQQAVKLAKSSLVNSIKLTGANSLPVADKHYQLGNIFFKIGKKQEALKQYLKTKQILEQHKQTTIPQYGVILLKLSLLYLNFGKISDCVGSSLQALKVFDANGGSQQQEIQTFQILSRSYQITRKTGDLASVGALCSQKFNNTQNPKIFQRMAKIVLLPKLSTISHQDAKILLKVVNKLEQLESPASYIDSFNYIHYRAQHQVIMKRLFNFIDNISNLYEDVVRKDLLRKHKCLSNQAKSEAADMLVLLQAVLTMTGYNFVNGSLRDNYY